MGKPLFIQEIQAQDSAGILESPKDWGGPPVYIRILLIAGSAVLLYCLIFNSMAVNVRWHRTTLATPISMPLNTVYWWMIGCLALFLPPVIYIAWVCPLCWKSTPPSLPGRSVLLLIIAVPLSIWWFAWAWGYRVRSPRVGDDLLFGLLSMNLELIISIIGIGIYATRRRSFWAALIANWLLFFWLFSYAFPSI